MDREGRQRRAGSGLVHGAGDQIHQGEMTVTRGDMQGGQAGGVGLERGGSSVEQGSGGSRIAIVGGATERREAVSVLEVDTGMIL